MMALVKSLLSPASPQLASELTEAQQARVEAERHREDAAQRRLVAETRYDNDASPTNEDALVRARLAEERAERLLAAAEAKVKAAAQKAADAERVELKKKLDTICDELDHERRVTEAVAGRWRVVPDGGRSAALAIRLSEIYLEARRLIAEAVDHAQEQEQKVREARAIVERIGGPTRTIPSAITVVAMKHATKAACFEGVMVAGINPRPGGLEGDLHEWLLAERQSTP